MLFVAYDGPGFDSHAVVTTSSDRLAVRRIPPVHPTSLEKRYSVKAAVNRSSESSMMLLEFVEIFSAASQNALRSRPPR